MTDTKTLTWRRAALATSPALLGAVSLALWFVSSCAEDPAGEDTSPATTTADMSSADDLSGEAPDTSSTLAALALDAPARVTGCDAIEVRARTEDGAAWEGTELEWRVEGTPYVWGHASSPDRIQWRATAVARPTTLRVIAEATDADGIVTHRGATSIEVAPRWVPPEAAPGMAPDCMPFESGVASGDPAPTTVLLWTRYSAASAETEPVVLAYEVAKTPGFVEISASGSVTARSEDDWTVQVEADGLAPGTTYYYRFKDPRGRTSRMGRTRTAPAAESMAPVSVAVASCSSVFSGFFNAYARIAGRAEVDLVVHLGDYIYDFVDKDEEVRLPDVYPTEPDSLEGWRARHALYLLDPDLRAARAAHPWVVLWDNHDIERAPERDWAGSIQAFREWVPMRRPDANDDTIAYRTLSFGGLMEVVLLDGLLHRNRDLVPDTEDAYSILGARQFAWLEEKLRASEAAWRLFGTQRVVATMRVNPALRGGGEFFDPKTWDGFPEDRARLFDLLRRTDTDSDNIVLAGDSHISVAMDLVEEPLGGDVPYVRDGEGSAGVEFLPTSISRGNFNEELGMIGGPRLFAQLIADTMARNPHHAFIELTRHGYGLLEIHPDEVIAEVWFSEILEPTDTEELGARLRVERGANHWEVLDVLE